MFKKSIIVILLTLSLVFTTSCFLMFMDLDESKIDSSIQETYSSELETEIDESTSIESESAQESQTSEGDINPTKTPLIVKPTSTPTSIPTTEIKVTEEISVHFIDVGQGDAILIKSSDVSILIDGGDRGTTVLNYLKANNVKELGLVVGTHPHADHIGGLINVIQEIPVKEILDPGIVHTTKTFEDYLTVIDEKNIKFTEARPGKNYNFLNGIVLEVLHPQNPSSSHLNDASIVIRMVYGDVSFMFAGDAEQASETQILGRSNSIKSTILKLGHHGSRTSTSQSFLDAVAPKIAIIMCGAGNSYGHPHSETISKLNSAKIETYRTDTNGTIVINTNGKTYSTKVNNKASPTLTIAPTKAPTPTITTAPILAPTKAPTATPTSAPTNILKVVSYTEQVIAGQIASITIKGKPNTEYTIKVSYKSGPSGAAGLEKKSTDANGNVSWSWKVGPSTTKGSWPIDITGGGESIRVYFEVT